MIFRADAAGPDPMTARSTDRAADGVQSWRANYTGGFRALGSDYRHKRWYPLCHGSQEGSLQGSPQDPARDPVSTAQLVLPGLTNVHGTIFGGILMQWIDIAAGIAAARHAGGPVVTASMDRLHS